MPFPSVSEEEASDEDTVARARQTEVDTCRSHTDSLFPSVSERTISADTILDSHLISIEETEEESDDVFFSPSYAHAQKSDRDQNMTISPKSQASITVHILPNVVNIDDVSYNYCSDEDNTLNDSRSSTGMVSELLEDVHITEEPLITHKPHIQCTSDIPVLVDTKITSSSQSVSVPVPPIPAITVTSSTPAKQASHPGTCLSPAPSLTSTFPEGVFVGEARHKDGSLLSIVFQVSCLEHDIHAMKPAQSSTSIIEPYF